jgi:rRNA maturation RNase YbeY
MPKSQTDITAKKSGLKITVFFSSGLRKDLAGGLSAATIERVALLFLLHHGIKSATLSLVFVTGPAIRKINKTHLGHDHVTDIITFDFGDDKAHCIDGELVICLTEAVRNARIFGEPVEREILRYVAHGILHLLGQDDATDKQRAAMRVKEDQLLELIS